MSEPDVVTAADIVHEHGRETLDRMLVYGWHYTEERGEPYWTVDRAEEILGLPAIEDGRVRDDA
jgi:hypothetical protein